MRELEYFRGNHLLVSLLASGCKDLYSHLELVPLAAGKVVYEFGGSVRHVYFPTTSIVSVLYIMNDGTSDEIATVGNEGFIGMQHFLGCEAVPSRALVRSAGHAVRLDAALLENNFRESSSTQHLLLRYMQSLLSQISQTSACNRLHSIRQRLCRWLLSSLDRLPSNELQTTHEYIGEMLNVRRESITEELGVLKTEGLIRCQRGRITVVNRPKLEACACECSQRIKSEYDRLLAGFTIPEVPAKLGEMRNRRATDSVIPAHFDVVPKYSPALPPTYARKEEKVSVRRYLAVPA
jgi:CRP-like cAMP-binding protein